MVFLHIYNVCFNLDYVGIITNYKNVSSAYNYYNFLGTPVYNFATIRNNIRTRLVLFEIYS